MLTTDIEVRYGLTVNLGNYESKRIDYQMRVQLEEGEKAGVAIDKTRDWLKGKMEEDLAQGKV